MITDLSPQQADGARKIRDWFTNPTQQVFRLFGYAGTGKAERHGSRVPTPNGPINIEDLRVGDQVFGADGHPVVVTGVFPQGVRDGYQVTFRDGVSVHCDGEHLWNVQTAKMRQRGQPYKTMSTREILTTGLTFDSGIYRFSIPLCDPVQYPFCELPIDPYVLGALIGDGTHLGGTPTLCIAAGDRFIADEVRRRLPSWAVMTFSRGTSHRHRITDPRRYGANEVGSVLTELGLAVRSPERFIPPHYLHSSVDQRWALLRGLMDTDGSARKNRVSYSTKSARLAADIVELVQSLGGTAIRHRTNRGGEHAINVKLMTCPFLLPRKAAEWAPSTKNPPSRRIVAVEPAGPAEHTCISVAATDGLYLTDHYVVTHNTSIARHIVDGLGVSAIFAAYTGKAAYVLRTRGCEDARTIHSLIYVPKEKVRARLDALRAQLADRADPDEDAEARLLERAIRVEEIKLDTPDWLLRDPDDCDLTDTALAVVDEVSMVGHRMAADLLSYGTKVLVLGDPAQLPPVDGGGYFIHAEPDHLLTEIHRSALDSPVTRLSTVIRGARTGDRGYGVVTGLDGGQDSGSGRIPRITGAALLQADQVLVGTNKTRWLLIHVIRSLRGLTGSTPLAGDRIICLANSGEAEVFNGQQFTVHASAPVDGRDDQLQLAVTDDDGRSRQLKTWRCGFVDADGEREAKRDGRGSVVAATFGQAITTHKAQGSQWNNVLVIDESATFAGMEYRQKVREVGRDEALRLGHVAGRRWMYTAVTRAAERVLIAPTP